jgi:hypothetical protein
MLNSLTVFLASFGFVVFGYLSLLRLLSKQNFGKVSIKQRWQGLSTAQFFSNLGSSAFFVSLPATSLLLFWGWGPALLWLLIFHIIIESLCHLQYSAPSNKNSIADFLLRSTNSKLAIVEQGLIQTFFLLSMAAVTALLATLIDRQSGLLFALLFLVPARSVLRHPSTALPLAIKIVAGLALLALGLAFSDQLGFSIYGDWAPLGESVNWLRFNNPSIIAAVLTIAVFQLERNTGFKKDLSTFAGIIIVLLVIAMTVQLVLAQPMLDAPMNTGQTTDDDLPSFISLCLFIFAGFAALLIRLLNEEESEEPAETVLAKAQQFARLQSGSLVQLGFMALLLLSIGSALGIGAWKTHFSVWNDGLNILDHLNLAISSTLHLIGTQTESGTLMHTILLAALCFTGLSFMLNCASQLSLEERENETILSLLIESKFPQAAGTFIAAVYFISNGISINVWLLIGMLAWVLVTHLVIGMTLAVATSGVQKSIFVIVAALLIIIGTLQSISLCILWFFNSDITYGISAILIIITAATLWAPSIPQLIQSFDKNSNEDLF